MKTALSLSEAGSRHNYKTQRALISPSTRRGASPFEAAVQRAKARLLSREAQFNASTRLLGLILLEHLNRTPGICSASSSDPGPHAPRWSCWPSVDTLAAESAMSARSVQRHLRALCDGPHAIFVRRVPRLGTLLFVHRGRAVHRCAAGVFELVEAPAALQAVRAARTAAQAAPAPHSAPNAAPAGPSVAEAAWSAREAPCAALGQPHVLWSALSDWKRRKYAQHARDVTGEWEALRPGVPVPWAALWRAYLALDEKWLVDRPDAHPFSCLPSCVARLVDAVAPVTDERQQAKRERDRERDEAYAALNAFATCEKPLRPVVEVRQAVEAARAVEGLDGLRQAVEAVTGGGWKFRGRWPTKWLAQAKAVRAGERWQEAVEPHAWQQVWEEFAGTPR